MIYISLNRFTVPLDWRPTFLRYSHRTKTRYRITAHHVPRVLAPHSTNGAELEGDIR